MADAGNPIKNEWVCCGELSSRDGTRLALSFHSSADGLVIDANN